SLLKIGVDVSAKNDRAGSRKLLITPSKLSCLHIIFEYADTCLGVLKACICDFIKEDNMLKADDPKLPRCLVIEQRRGSCFTTRHDKSAAGCITERVGFSCFSGAKFY